MTSVFGILRIALTSTLLGSVPSMNRVDDNPSVNNCLAISLVFPETSTLSIINNLPSACLAESAHFSQSRRTIFGRS